MTLMELLGMERQQLQTRRELETLRLEARAAQVRRIWGRVRHAQSARVHVPDGLGCTCIYDEFHMMMVL